MANTKKEKDEEKDYIDESDEPMIEAIGKTLDELIRRRERAKQGEDDDAGDS